ncbi:MAG TPA: MotA/TolQ/ExbB proton channel family protein [Cytophagaceae bacterium]
MKNTSNLSDQLKSGFALIVIPVTLVLSFLLFKFILGNPGNFSNGDPVTGDPLNYLGIVYKGGVIVPVLISFFIIVVTFSIERFITLSKAYGNGNLGKFIQAVKEDVKKNNIDTAINKAEQQKGSVGNVIYSVLKNFPGIVKDASLPKDQKKQAVQQELEEALALELPILEKNLTIIASLASTATLVGLLGTVIGMIKAFAALATSGAPDATALANGISEALINTALGIATSTVAIWSYNYFTSRIDTLIFHIDEIGFTITQQITHIHAGNPSARQKEIIEKSEI